jgi:thiol-disulfide isomerase/thioredoxin
MTLYRQNILVAGAVAMALGAAFLSESRMQAREEPPAPLRMAPVWNLTDLDGHEVRSDQFKGKVVIVDFWATWCQPCVSEIPGYVSLQNKYGEKGLVIVGVLYRDPKTSAFLKKFAAEKAMNYHIVIGDDTIADAFGGLEALPTTFLIDRTGRIVQQKVGTMDREAYAALVKRALD